MTNYYVAGRQEALRSLGLIKTANPLRRFGTWAYKKIPTWHKVKQETIGSPSRFMDEVAMGRALSKGSLIRESFKAPTPMSKIMFYGPSAVEVVGAATDKDDQKAKRIGEALGSATLGFGAYRPLGILGSMAVDPLGRAIGGAVGQTIGHVGSTAVKGIQNHLG